jgi:hypothetical protein
MLVVVVAAMVVDAPSTAYTATSNGNPTATISAETLETFEYAGINAAGLASITADATISPT